MPIWRMTPVRQRPDRRRPGGSQHRSVRHVSMNSGGPTVVHAARVSWRSAPVAPAAARAATARRRRTTVAAAVPAAHARAVPAADGPADPARCPTSTCSSPASGLHPPPAGRRRRPAQRLHRRPRRSLCSAWPSSCCGSASGFYRVQPDEHGVVHALRRLQLPHRARPALAPALADRARPAARRSPASTAPRSATARRGQQTDVTGSEPGGRDVPSESLMLTGDENIIDINLTVFWKISNAADYLFNTRDPDNLVKAVAESSIREVIGRTPIQPALTQLRAQIETDVLQPDAADPGPLRRRHRDHPGAVAEGRSAGRGDRELPRRAARQHRRRAHAQRGPGLPNDIVPRARGDAAAHRRRGRRVPSRPRSRRPPARRSVRLRC